MTPGKLRSACPSNEAQVLHFMCWLLDEVVQRVRPMQRGVPSAIRYCSPEIAALLGTTLLALLRQARPARGDLAPLGIVALGVVIGLPILPATWNSRGRIQASDTSWDWSKPC